MNQIRYVLAMAVVVSMAATGCATGQQTTQPHKQPVQQHEVDARAAAKAARSTDGAAKRSALPPQLARAMASYKSVLNNAAERDREMEGIIRRYLTLTRGVFQHFTVNRPRRGQAPSMYDPMPAWRYQAQQSFEYRLLAARAAMLRKHLAAMASEQQFEITRQAKGGDRQSRVSLYSRIFDCIRDDAMARANHGRRYLAIGEGTPPRMKADARAGLYRDELLMMRRSVTCTTLTSMRRKRMVGLWRRPGYRAQ